jgi:hypothetical protein
MPSAKNAGLSGRGSIRAAPAFVLVRPNGSASLQVVSLLSQTCEYIDSEPSARDTVPELIPKSSDRLARRARIRAFSRVCCLPHAAARRCRGRQRPMTRPADTIQPLPACPGHPTPAIRALATALARNTIPSIPQAPWSARAAARRRPRSVQLQLTDARPPTPAHEASSA